MSDGPAKRPMAVVTACMRKSDGTPAFALTEVHVTQEEAENGIHYYLTEAELLEKGFEEPFVHFDQEEAPAFLHPAVRQHLHLLPVASDPPPYVLSEER